MLVVVKAYPAISTKYGEVECVAGIRTDMPTPEWVRLFPVPFRDLPYTQRFQKYQLVRFQAEPHGSDTRPESLRPNVETFECGEVLETRKDKTWSRRRAYVEPLELDSMCEIVRRRQTHGTSLRRLPAGRGPRSRDRTGHRHLGPEQGTDRKPDELARSGQAGPREDPVQVPLPLPLLRSELPHSLAVDHRLGTEPIGLSLALALPPRGGPAREDPRALARPDVARQARLAPLRRQRSPVPGQFHGARGLLAADRRRELEVDDRDAR